MKVAIRIEGTVSELHHWSSRCEHLKHAVYEIVFRGSYICTDGTAADQSWRVLARFGSFRSVPQMRRGSEIFTDPRVIQPR